MKITLQEKISLFLDFLTLLGTVRVLFKELYDILDKVRRCFFFLDTADSEV